MNTNETSTLQWLQSQLRESIHEISKDIVALKILKKQADEAGEIEMEYSFHNNLQNAKKSLKRFVTAQMLVKQLLREAYDMERMDSICKAELLTFLNRKGIV